MAAITPDNDRLGTRVTIRDVAARAGFSVATVSRVLSGHLDVSPETRVAVLQHARELGYVKRRSASTPPPIRLRRESRLLGLSVPDLRNEFVAEIVMGAAEAMQNYNARLVICPDQLRSAPLRDRLMVDSTHGTLLVLPSAEADELITLLENGYPLVVVEPTLPLAPTIPAVSATDWSGARHATEYLIELGHTHIGIITGPEGWQLSRDRLAGYQAALLSAGLPLLPHLRHACDLTVGGGYRAAQDLLGRPHVPSAIFALGTSIAVGVLQAARERSLDVPHDLSVVTFDDTGTTSITVPPLTAVRQPLQGEGRIGVDMLCRQIEGQQLDARRIELSTELIVRGSTAPPHGASFLT